MTRRTCNTLLVASLLIALGALLAVPGANARPRDLVDTRSRIDFEQLYHFARKAADTYQETGAIRDRHPGVSWIATPGHNNVLYFIETDDARRTHTIAVRGTVDDTNWQLDMDTHGAFDEKAGVLVHRGFNTVARTIYVDAASRLNPAYSTWLTGHSFGGVVAAILATYLDRDGYSIAGVYTFGQPKFTNAEGVRRYFHLPILRVVYQNDAVAMLPDAVKSGNARFVHLGPEIVLLNGPYFCYLDEAEAAHKSVRAFSRGMTFSSLPDHKMKWYLQDLSDKLKAARAVPYAKRQQYVKRHRMGTGLGTASAKKVTNFSRRATY